MAHYEKTGRKGHGCCGGIFALVLVCIVMLCLLMFSTDMFSGTKNKVMGVFYPQKYSEYVTKYSEQYSVDESLVYAVIRTESSFREDVQSSAGAMGLMQIMPDTFVWLQDVEDNGAQYLDSDLLNPQINIKYGTYYLSILLEHYNGNEKLALAAYNGGMTNVDNWLEDDRYSSDGKNLNSIPYKETSKYVERVEKTKQMYETIYYDKK